MSNLLLCIQQKHCFDFTFRVRWNKIVLCYKIAAVRGRIKSHFPDTMSRVFSVTTESCETIKVDRERESYGPTAQCVKIFHCNVLQNDMEIPVFRT